MHPVHYWTGEGREAIEVAYGTSGARPNSTSMREIWKDRQGKAAAPLLLVIAYPESTPTRAVVCGPTGDDPPVVDLDHAHAERLADTALAEPNRHLATRFLADALEGDAGEQPGLRNKGLFATHELRHGVPLRSDWSEAAARAAPLLGKRDQELVRELGYEIEDRGKHDVLRSSNGNARAIAVFLQETEQADQPSQRFNNQTPVTHALTEADRDNVPWVVAVRGGTIRLYSTTTSGAAGQRGRAETFAELNLPLLPSEDAGYLDLLFSATALTEGGTVSEIQRASTEFTSELSARLRERVYNQVVPHLAVAVAREVGGTREKDLELHYRTTLTILFRLLFVSYAEDSRLLPLDMNGEYTDHSLKSRARRLSETMNAGRDLGFDNPLTREIEPATDSSQTDLWDSCQALFHAVDTGHHRWGVPAYNGGLFSSKPEVNPVGKTIEGLSLTNADFGPALTALIVDRSPDEIIGPIDFRSLSVREFGTIYEGLLESELSVADQPLTVDKDGVYLPAKKESGEDAVVGAGEVYLHNRSGTRKSTGSYFTKPFAVDHTIAHSVDPTLDEHLERVLALLENGKEREAADLLFDFRVADISMGSGHFLTAVVDRLEARYTTFLADHPIAAVSVELDQLRAAAREALGPLADTFEIENSSLLRRLIARRCVYGVDMNPLSVELARVAMWIHTFVPGLPLSFLDHNLAVGDSLTGIGTIEEATAELIDDSVQASLFDDPLREALAQAKEPLKRLANIADATPADINKAREAAEDAREAVAPVSSLFDRVIAARTGESEIPTVLSADELFTLDSALASEVARKMRALHFPIAFPEVFLRERPGFDVIVGNPPWDKVKVETHEFWGRHFPGFRGLPQREKETARAEYEAARPDLSAELEAEKANVERLKKVISSGPYDLGSGDTELARVFAWRFWHLLRPTGRLGTVLPRQAILSAPGMGTWRRTVLDDGAFDDVCLLENKGKWVFDDIDVRYTVALVTVARGVSQSIVRLEGPYRSRADYEATHKREPMEVSAEEFSAWSSDLSFPAFRAPGDVPVYSKLLQSPAFGDDRPDWEFRPVREIETYDKHLFNFAEDPPDDMWPIYSGASFNLWTPETGRVYAWADPEEITNHIFEKRLKQARHARSAFSELPDEVIADKATLACESPRIAFRDVARATDQRTVIAALIPPHVIPHEKAPYLLRITGDETAEAYVLGVLCSRIFDWCARRQVETKVSFALLDALPVPAPEKGHPVRTRIVEIAGRLAAVDERYRRWADTVGVPVGSVGKDEKPALLTELDACVARLYGLSEDELRHLYATFHYGWDHEPWTAAVLEHFRQIDWGPAEVSR